jgi:alcohol dehydrogenase
MVIGLGGDVILNAAKVVSLLLTNPGETSDYLTEQGGYRLNINRKPVPCLLVPTAFGTLCEAAFGFVVKDAYDDSRKRLYNQIVQSNYTFLDPRLSAVMGKKYLAASGLLVLTYSIELFISNYSNPFSQMYAQRALDIVNYSLEPLNEDIENMDHRANMFHASLMVSYAESCSKLGAIYAICEAVSSVAPIYKGTVAAIMLPTLMEYNLTTIPSKYVQIAKIFGEDVNELSVLEAAIKAVERTRRFVENFGLPSRLRDLGFEKSMIPKVVSIFSLFDESLNVPREISKRDLTAILEQAY